MANAVKRVGFPTTIAVSSVGLKRLAIEVERLLVIAQRAIDVGDVVKGIRRIEVLTLEEWQRLVEVIERLLIVTQLGIQPAEVM